jgi:hypothetical protein
MPYLGPDEELKNLLRNFLILSPVCGVTKTVQVPLNYRCKDSGFDSNPNCESVFNYVNFNILI